MSAFGGFALAAAQSYFTGKTIKALLVTSSYTQDVDAHVNRSNLPAGSEITGGTYPAGGLTAANVTVTYVAADDAVHVDCDDLAFTGLTATDVGGIIFYVVTGDPATETLLTYDQFSSPVDTSVAGTLTYVVSDNGFLTVDVAA